MFNIGGQEFALIIVLALVVVGPEQLPGLIRKLGHYAAQARRMSSSLRAEFMAATEPMHDTFKEFQEGMNEFQTGMNDFGKSVTDAADVSGWGDGTPDDPIVPRGFAETAAPSQSSNSTTESEQSGADPDPNDPWAADRVQPITQPTREKTHHVPPPVNPWDPIHEAGSGTESQTESAARQLEQNQESVTTPALPDDGSSADGADEEPA